MLINTIESTRNFAVNVDNWAMVDFLDFAKIASMVGPITVTVTKEEAADINPLIREACQLNDAYYGTDVPRCYFPTDQDGTYTISDGFQILGYCRRAPRRRRAPAAARSSATLSCRCGAT